MDGTSLTPQQEKLKPGSLYRRKNRLGKTKSYPWGRHQL